MRVESDRSRTYHGRKYDDRLNRRNYRNNEYHSRNHSSRSSLNPRHEYSSSSSSSRFDRQTNNRDIYPTISNDQPPTALYYNSSQPIRERGLSSYTERNRYSNYRREDSPYRTDSYRSPTPPPPTEQYNDMYRASDYTNRSERYDIGSNRNYPMTSPIIYRSDPYRTSSVIPMPSPPPPSSSSSLSSRDQYVQTVREADYRTRDYGMTMDHRQINSNNSSDRYHDDYHSTSSYRDRTNLKRSRSDFNENGFKRPMRR